MPKVAGRIDSLVLITDGDNAVVLDTDFNIIVEGGPLASLQDARKWESTDYALTEELGTLTASALAIYIQSPIVAAGTRMYTIPKAAQEEAKKALEWRKKHKRGGTPVGINSARTLARGGQIGIEKVRHIAKYFPRHEVDKQGKGWKPGEDNFPSNGRIAWALWGGNAGWRWAVDIVETENNKQAALKASGFSESESVFYNETDPLESFKEAYSSDIARGPEFVARVRLDGSGIDRLYKVDVDGRVYVWDDGVWEDLASIDGDVWTYDKALDDPYDLVEKSHIEIDPESAIIIAARLEQAPHANISIFDIDRDEAELMAQHIEDIDWAFMDKAIIAAGESFEKTAPASDGVDTPEERAQRASSQARDAFGKFIPNNGRVTIGGDPKAAGTSSGLNPDGTLKVKLDNGNEINVDPKLVQNEGEGGQAQEPNMRPTSAQSDFDAPLDTSGILGEPRTPIDQPKAQLPGTLPRMTTKDLHEVLYNWDSWVREQRDSFKPDPMVSSGDEEVKGEHELLKKLKRKKTASESIEADEAWAKPEFATDTSSEPEREVNPDTSDVKPLYLVLVAEDDPRAVLDLVALVPASNKSTAPMTYRRADQKWVRAENILIDMKSATPPPTIALDEASLQDVLKQVDGVLASAGFNPDQAFMVLWGPNQDLMNFIESSLTAAGKPNRLRGNAEKLRRYWVSGLGAAKIRWGAGGDWKRCVRYLSKYLGTRAKGYCQLRHKEALGYYTSTHAKKLGKGRGRSNSIEQQDSFIMEETLYGVPTDVTNEDMLISIEEIVQEQDDLYDSEWEPEADVVEACKELAQSSDEEFNSLVAAGGADRNRGNAENLREYWTRGKGAAKIRWGTAGDWKRCVRYLSKYIGTRAKGYCQLRHKDALGYYTATHAKRDRARSNSSQEFIMEVPTKISNEDMLMPINDIHAEEDSYYDDSWTPEPEIVESCEELASCTEEEYQSLIAAGGLDRNRGNAEELRRYWTTGKGGAKIRWGTGGDWTRCVRNLSKYMGVRSKGYCALRHKEMNGIWPGDKPNRQIASRKRGLTSAAAFSTKFLNATNHVIELAVRDARIQDARDRINGITASGLEEVGSSFSIPLVIPEGIESGDGRRFRKGAISVRELPLPLLWQIKTSDGHMGSVVVGRIDRMERVDGGIGNAYGVFDSGVYGKEAERLVRNGFIRGVSADMDQFEAEEAKEAADNGETKKDKLIINKARVMAATIVPKPAFQECQIFLLEEEPTTLPQEDIVIPDGVYAEEVDPADAAAIVACGYVAGAIPLTPPTEWFNNPKLTKATPLTVSDDGKVFGHIAAWHVDHIGMAGGTKPPRSKSKYAYFHSGVIRTTDGTDVPVGQLTLAGGHAPLHASAQQAAKHYDDTASAFADVHAGEDNYGIWVSGSLRPGISPEQVRAVRASAPSGDWRPIRGSLELVAVCQVNVPGFPIARAMVASGQVMALVAAGAQVLAKMKSDPMTELNERLARLETFTTAELNTRSESAKALFAEVKAQRNTELSARITELSSKIDSVFSYDDEFANFSRRERKSLAQEGKAMPDGSFPIRNEDDLKNAISSYGRAKEGKRAAVRNFIIKRARQLKRNNLVPQEWKDAATAEFNSRADQMRLTASMFSAIVAAPVEIQPILDENGDPILDKDGNPVMGTPTPTQTPTAEGDSPKKADAVEPATPEQVTDNPEMIDVVDKSTNLDGQAVDGKYISGKTQPRDEAGKFRKVLARLKQDLGVAGLQDIVEEAKTVEGLHEVGNYTESAAAAGKLLEIVDRLDSGALNKVSLENVRSSAAELGKVISNLPLGFNNQAEKLKYSDLPPALSNLMDDMIDRVEKKIGKEDADIATAELRAFKSGSDVYSQAEISSQMSKLLRLLT